MLVKGGTGDKAYLVDIESGMSSRLLPYLCGLFNINIINPTTFNAPSTKRQYWATRCDSFLRDPSYRTLLKFRVPSQYQNGLTVYEISFIKRRRSWDRLIFIMGLSILVRRHLHIETAQSCPKCFLTSGQFLHTCLKVYDFPLIRSTLCQKDGIAKLDKLDSTRRKASEICLRPPLDIYSHTFSRYCP